MKLLVNKPDKSMIIIYLICEKHFVPIFSTQQAFLFQSFSRPKPLIHLLPIFTTKSDSMKMYVGNLMYNMTEEELRSLFTPFGEVLYSRIITDQYTRQSKNIGYVKMAVKEEGKTAVKELNGKIINNRILIVRKA